MIFIYTWGGQGGDTAESGDAVSRNGLHSLNTSNNLLRYIKKAMTAGL